MLSVGKRFTCEACGTQVMVIKAGDEEAELRCCGQSMALEEPKQVASSD
jgi:transcription elongation factor Elf1